MSLRPLAGPFDIIHGELGTDGDVTGAIFWHPHIGLYAAVRFATPDFVECRIALDGVTQEVGSLGEVGSFGWWEDVKRKTLITTTASVWGEWFFDQYGIVRSPVVNGATFDLSGLSYVRRNNRWYYYQTGNIVEVDVDGNVVQSVAGIGETAATVGPGRGDGELFIGSRNGVISRFYNARTREYTGSALYISEEAIAIVYAPEFGIIVSLHFDDPVYQIRVWSLEVIPFEVTAPEVLFGTVQAGQVVTYRVQVLGEQGEPCPNELVDWTIEGVGTLLSVQSKTDVNGYAITKVSYGADDGDEDSTVIGSVKC